jgi:hypothetical protein
MDAQAAFSDMNALPAARSILETFDVPDHASSRGRLDITSK